MLKQNPDILSYEVRKQIIQSISSEENKARKRKSKRNFDIINDEIEDYVVEQLNKEFGIKSASEMRKVTHINLGKRIVNEKSEIYTTEPTRNFVNATDKQKEQLENIYELAEINTKMARANRCYNTARQGFIYFYPMEGKINARILWPHQVDVVPDVNNPEKAFAYVLNVFENDLEVQSTRYNSQDNVNQLIADRDDPDGVLNKFVIWTNEVHYSMNEKGQYILEPQPNPIGMMPIVEFSIEKDAKFFCNVTPSLANFTIDACLDLSDLSNISRLQGFAQAVISATKPPENFTVGPNKIIFLQQDSLPDSKEPRFEFISPTSNIEGTLSLVIKKLELYMIGEGIDPKILNADGSVKTYSSGFERLVAMIQKFQASKTDFDLFKMVEIKSFKILVAWSNALQSVVGDYQLVDELRIATIPDSVYLDVVFAIPEDVQTKAEREASVEKKINLGLMSKKRAIMEIENIDDAQALEYLKEIQEDEAELIKIGLMNNPRPIENEATEDVADENEDNDVNNGEEESSRADD